MSSFNNKICVKKNNTIHIGINILTHCTFLLAIIASVYFLFTEKIMSNALNFNVTDLAKKTIYEYYYVDTKPEDKQVINTALKSANLETLLKLYNSPTEDRTINNSWIEKLIYTVIALLIVATVFTILTTKGLCDNLSVLEILSENIVIFIFVGVVEYLFFTKIIINYIPAYPSTLSNVFFNELKNYK
jgi:ABC-type uncharacterized transport system permease subunit